MNLLKPLINLFKKKVVDESLPTLPVEKEEVVEVAKPKRKFGNNGTGSTWKLQETDRQLIVSLWATGLTPSEIIEKMKEEHNIEITNDLIIQYSNTEKWQPLIKKVREVHMNDLASVGGSHKRVRLQRHEKIYDKAISKNKFDVALKATEAQRKEMEEGNVTLTLNQFNVLSDDELEHKKNEVMQRIKLLSQKGGVLDVVSSDKREATGS